MSKYPGIRSTTHPPSIYKILYDNKKGKALSYPSSQRRTRRYNQPNHKTVYADGQNKHKLVKLINKFNQVFNFDFSMISYNHIQHWNLINTINMTLF